MLTEQAHKIVRETFENSFNKDHFAKFVRELLNKFEAAPFNHRGNLIPDAYDKYISTFERLGKYSDGENKIDILIVGLKKETSIERARTMQRNFIARYLNGSRGGELKDAALAAFVSPDKADWRFSLVRMQYEYDTEKKKIRKELTPAKRWSFLVGANENSHTAQRQFVPLLKDDKNNPALKNLEEAFNIEKVTKEFFEKYRDLFLRTFETLQEVINRNSSIKNDFEDKGVSLEDFSKKLLGQIVFLYFLQKKGWFGVPMGKSWGEGDKRFLRTLFKRAVAEGRNYFNDYLEPLFYEALAKERDDDYYSRFECRIPFLNGGLFDPISNYDWVNTFIDLPDDLFSNERKDQKTGDIGDGILDIFDRYNFTVKEDEPLEKEVAVDPEMLGKVFENLLEVKDRKSKGTYYTPREIVHYMCEQSIINYLAAELEGKVSTQDLEQLLKYGEAARENEARVENEGRETNTYYYKLPESIRKNAKEIDSALANIKVCDPAIGSGAFPVGIMHEIVKARLALNPYLCEGQLVCAGRSPYDFKFECIHNSLYGVDIDPGAVEIAKLRLWLSLVVDESDIRRIKPLPNLDYKIMQGNSLLEEYEGVKLFDESMFSPADKGSDREIEDLKRRQSELQSEYFNLNSRNKLTPGKEAKFKKELKIIAGQLKKLNESKQSGSVIKNQMDSFSVANEKSTELKRLHEEFFQSTRKKKKDELKKRIEVMEWELIETTLREQDKISALEKLEQFKKSNIKPFFLWKLHFAKVFEEKGGFDVVIANPPYVRQEMLKDQKASFARQFETYTGIADLYVYFYEKGTRLLNHGGTIALITSNKFYRAGYGEKLRGFLARELTLHRLIDFGDAPVFEAIAYASILVGVRTAPAHDASALAYTWEKEMPFERITQIVPERGQQIRQDELKPDGWRLESPAVLRLLEKLRRAGKPLGEYVNGRLYYGIKTGFNKAFVVDRATRDRLINDHPSSAEVLKPFLRGRDVKRWRTESEDLWLVFIPWHFPLHDDQKIAGASTKTEAEFRKGFPAIYKHLSQFKEELSARNAAETGIRYEWYALQRWGAEYWKEFEQTKIVIPAITSDVEYAADYDKHYSNDKTSICITSEPNYLLGLLNSKVLWWFIRQTAASKQGGFYEFKLMYVSALPIPAVPTDKQKPVERLVERILSAKQQDAGADLSALEREIDLIVYKLYDLTPEEIKIVENSQR